MIYVLAGPQGSAEMIQMGDRVILISINFVKGLSKSSCRNLQVLGVRYGMRQRLVPEDQQEMGLPG